jgi:LPS export ABC transporter protein LptC
MKSIIKNKHLLLLTLLILLTLFSCSFAEDASDKKDPAVHPDLSLYNTTYKIGRSDGNPFIIEADRIDIYKKDNKALGNGISFTKYDDQGELDLQGTCNSIDIDTKNEDAKLTGNVSLNIEKEGLLVQSLLIKWDSETSTLDTGDGEVTVIWEDENKIIGKGFTANLRTRVFEFGKIKNGIINEKN